MLLITHYDLEAKLEFAPESMPRSAPGTLHVAAALGVQNRSATSLDRLPLVFYRLHTVRNVQVDGRRALTKSNLTRVNGRENHHVNTVEVHLPEPLSPGNTCTVTLEYSGVTAGAREVYQYIHDSVRRDYTLLRPDVTWYPVAALPDSTSLHDAYMQKKHFTVTVHVPEGYTAAAPEPAGNTGNVAVFKSTLPRERFDLAIAPFLRLNSRGITVYHLPGNEQWGKNVIEWTEASIDGLSERLGPRLISNLAIAEIPQGWGSQHSPNFILQEPGSHTGWPQAASVIHEITHFWTPVPSDWPRRFSDESLASFFQYLIVADIFGDCAANEQLTRFEQAVARAKGAKEAKFLDQGLPRHLHNSVWYAKGAVALKDLRNRIGEEAFWQLLREYTQTPEATTQQFVDMLQRRHTGEHISEYIRHWFVQ